MKNGGRDTTVHSQISPSLSIKCYPKQHNKSPRIQMLKNVKNNDSSHYLKSINGGVKLESPNNRLDTATQGDTPNQQNHVCAHKT